MLVESEIRVIPPAVPGEELVPFSPALVAGRWVFLSGQMAAGPEGLAAEATIAPGLPFYADPHSAQSSYIFARLRRLMEEAGGSIDDLVRITQWFPVPDGWKHRPEWGGLSITRFLEERNRHISRDRPASVGLGIRALPVPDAVVAVDVIGLLSGGTDRKESIYPKTEKHQVLAGYSPAIRMGDWVFCSGEVPTDWKGDWMSTAHMGTPSSLAPDARVNPYQWLDYPIRRQTEYVLQKLAETAEAAGTRLENAVKATVYLLDPSDFYGFEEVWRAWFPASPPARTVIPHVGLGPVGARVEVALDLLLPGAAARRRVIESGRAPEPLTHEPQAILADDLLFFSGQMALDARGLARSAQVPPSLPFYESRPKKQLNYILQNVAAICEAAGTSLANLVRVQQIMTDLRDLPACHEVWRERFAERPPSGFSCEAGSPLLVLGCDLLLDVIAYVPGNGAPGGR